MAVFGYACIILGIFFGDLWVKNRVESCGAEREGSYFLLRKHHNRGVVLNFGQNRRRAVAAVSVALTAALSVLFVCSLGQRGNRLLRLGLSFLLGGAFSNTYDRLKRKYVVDYFSFNVRWEPLRRIVFNFSDFCILAGAMLIVIGAS